MKASVILSFAVLFFSASLPAWTQKPVKFKKYNTKEYSISHPQDWQFDFSGVSGTRFILISPSDSEQDNFNENFNLLIQNLAGFDIELSEYTRLSVEEIKNSIPDAAVISVETKSGINGPFSRVVFSGSQGNFRLIWIQDYYKKRNNIYLLTFSCEEETFERYRAKAEQIMATFRIK